MTNQDAKPVVLLIYANTGEVLESLKPETEVIESHLVASGLCDVRIIPAATLADVVTAINEPELRDRVSIVHYAGHANGQGIQLQSSGGGVHGETAYMRGLAEVLSTQPHLRLLFINGCASREQVLELTQAGIPLVIATNQGIDDKVAREFAECFYRTLGQQRSIADAFQVAAGMVKSAAGENMRGLYFGVYQKSVPATKNDLPWELHGPDADRHWSLRDPFYRGTGPRWDQTKYKFNPESPYLGLRYFTEEESSRFFGRDEFVQTLLKASASAPLLLVIGASGTGKSSVVRAGMIPNWKKLHRSTTGCRAFVFTPQDDPFDQLSTSLAAVDTFDRQQIRSVRETPSKTALRDAVKTFGQGEPWLFFVDQFEQIFTRTTDQKKRDDFLDAITDLAKSEHSNVCLVLAMRDDFFPQLRDYPELFPLTDKHCFRVAALSREALEEVIQRPAAENGVTFQPGLVAKIVNAIDRQPGALPLLQYALDALWKAEDLTARLLNINTYKRIGGVTGSLGSRLQKLYDQQIQAGKDHFRWMMLKLVTYDESATGSNVVSRLTPKTEFAGKQSELLDQLIALGLVVSSGTSTPSVQLGHEKIIEAWPEFLKWTQECREANIVRQQLSHAANEWVKLDAQKEKKKKSRSLWQGSQLEKALELRKSSDFVQLGGLNTSDNCFLDESEARSQRLVRGLLWAVGISTGLLFIAIGLGGFGWQQYRTAKHQIAIQDLSDAALAIREHRYADALHWYGAAYEDAPKSSLMGGEEDWTAKSALRLLGALSQMQYLMLKHDDSVNAVAFSPDGRAVLTGCKDGTALLWNVETGEQLIGPLKHNRSVVAVGFSGDGQTLVTGSNGAHDGEVQLWDSQTGKVRYNAPLKLSRVEAVAISPNGEKVITGDSGGLALSWDAREGKKEEKFIGIPIRKIVFSPDGETVLTGGPTFTARLWDAKLGDPRIKMQLDAELVDAAFSRDGQKILTGSRLGKVQLWNAKSGAEEWQKVIARDVLAVAFCSNDQTVITGHRDGTANLLDVGSGTKLCEWNTYTIAGAMAFSPDGETTITGCSDGTARLWKMNSGKRLGEPMKLESSELVHSAAFDKDSKLVLTGCSDGVVKLWEAQTGKKLNEWQKHDGNVGAVAFSRNGKTVLTAGDDNKTIVWDIDSKENYSFPLASGSYVSSATFSPDGKKVLTVEKMNRGDVCIWDAITGNKLRSPPKHDSEVVAAAFSPDGRKVLTASSKTAKQWDMITGAPIGDPLSHDGLVVAVAYSPDGQTVVTSGRKTGLWDARSGYFLGTWNSHESMVRAVAFTPDGQKLLTLHENTTMRTWDVPAPSAIEPEQLRLWVEVQTGSEFNNVSRTPQPLSQNEWLKRRKRTVHKQGP